MRHSPASGLVRSLMLLLVLLLIALCVLPVPHLQRYGQQIELHLSTNRVWYLGLLIVAITILVISPFFGRRR